MTALFSKYFCTRFATCLGVLPPSIAREDLCQLTRQETANPWMLMSKTHQHFFHPLEFALTIARVDAVRKRTMPACVPPVLVTQTPLHAFEKVLSSALVPAVHD